MTRRWAFVTIGLAAGFSGLAVVATFLTVDQQREEKTGFTRGPSAAAKNIGKGGDDFGG